MSQKVQQIKKTEQKIGEHAHDNVQSSNQESIHYDDGKIQKKIYGGDEAGQMHELIVHTIQRTKEQVQTYIIRIQGSLTFDQVCTLIGEKVKKALNNFQVQLKLGGSAADLKTAVSDLFKQKAQDKPQIFIFYDETKAIIKQKVSQIKYEPLTKYSFLDDKNKVKVYVQLEGIGKLPAENITSRFLEWSLQIKIHGYKGKNWIFAVPKTQCLLRPKQSKVLQKQNKLIISIAKNAQSDNWFSLYKVKCVGERDE